MNLLVSISRNIYPLDERAIERAQKRWDDKIHPKDSLGQLEDITKKLAGIYCTNKIEDQPKKCIIAFGADHGVHDEGVSPQPQIITRMQLENFARGLTGVGVLAKFNNTDLIPIDIGVLGDEPMYGVVSHKIRQGTDNIAKGPAMTMDEAVKSIELGIEIAEKCIVEGYKIIGIGEMGISNTTPSTAILSVMSGKDPIDIADVGADIGLERVKHKADVLRKAIEINNPNPTDGIEVLAKVGGFDIGGMTGVILGCAANRIPVVVDGFISYAAALIAYRINPRSKDYLIMSHKSDEKGSETALSILGIKPMLDMDMRLGEGTGAALAMNIIDSSIYAYNHMGEFKDLEIGRVLGLWDK